MEDYSITKAYAALALVTAWMELEGINEVSSDRQTDQQTDRQTASTPVPLEQLLSQMLTACPLPGWRESG